MPHCIIEHSDDLDANKLNQLVFESARTSGLFSKDGKDIKVRSIAYSHYQVGSEKTSFVHVVMKILSGRTLLHKQTLSAEVMGAVMALEDFSGSVTVEVVDMEKDSYSKIVL